MKMLFLFLLSLNALADCNVYVPVKEFFHAGLSIRLDFTSVLESRGYREVNDPSNDRQLLIEGIEQEGRFHKAVTKLTMEEVVVEDSVTCITQLCGLSDFAKSFRKSYKKFGATLPHCQD